MPGTRQVLGTLWPRSQHPWVGICNHGKDEAQTGPRRVLPAGQAFYVWLILESPLQACLAQTSCEQSRRWLRECERPGQGAPLLLASS